MKDYEDKSGFDGYPKTMWGIYNFLKEAIPVLEKENILEKDKASFVYEDIVIELINKLSKYLMLSDTTKKEALAKCTNKNEKMAWLYLNESQQHKLTSIPYYFFSCALQIQREKYRKIKTKAQYYEILCDSPIQELAEWGDKIIAVFALLTDFSKSKSIKSKNIKYNPFEEFFNYLKTNQEKFSNLIFKNEVDFFFLWDKRSFFFRLDEGDITFFKSLVSLSPKSLTTIKSQYKILTIEQFEKIYMSAEYQNWLTLLKDYKGIYDKENIYQRNPLYQNLSKIINDFKTLELQQLLKAFLLVTILSEYRVTYDDLLILSLYHSMSDSEQKEILAQLVDDMSKSKKYHRLFRMEEVLLEGQKDSLEAVEFTEAIMERYGDKIKTILEKSDLM